MATARTPRVLLRALRPFLTEREWHAPLLSRGVLAISGRDARKLLQGLVTSDVTELDAGPQYTAFLSAQGRLLTDAFLVGGTDGSVLVDTHWATLPDLVKHLKRYKLRSKVEIRDASGEYDVVASNVGGTDGAGAPPPCEGGTWADPRLPLLGTRQLRPLQPNGYPVGGGASSAMVPEELYQTTLALLGVPSHTTWASDALPLEANFELLNAVSFAKGCYLGQELTARTHFRGVVRKRLLPVASARRLARAPAAGVGPEDKILLAALAHLPETELRLAAALFDETAADDESEEAPAAAGAGAVDEGGAADDEAEEEAGARTLRAEDGGGKVGTLRAFEPSMGLGMATVRLEALKKGGSCAVEGGASLVPLRPSWWPENV